MFKFHPKYFYATVLLFLVEVFIGVFVHDRFIRPFCGDVLVVILIYCFFKSFWKIRPNIAIASVFIFACIVEWLQYLNLVDILGIRQYKLLVIILGSSFDWYDILAYATGSVILLWWENKFISNSRSK
jgi:glucan phosphoethanolaminetransferase (alkaline phosphatase superfamily)